jgi:predicted ATPase/class 3 adenylate cyclase
MALPDGRLTLLFTDVEGSTRLLDRLQDRYAAVIGRHHRVVRDAVLTHGGHEVQTEGDAFFVVFERASDAVCAAGAIQRELAAVSWPDGVAVRVRIGLHTGEARLVDGEYVGMDVHRAARICSAGHGGQVLLSEATRRSALTDAARSPATRDLGEHQLKDLREPLHLHQLWIEGLPGDFPPVRSLGTRPTNLPAEPGDLIGRDAELATASRLLRRSGVRLVTVTGPGGIGKTRFALRVAAEQLEHFQSGAFVVYLAAVSDASLVAAAIAQALAVREQPGEPLEEALTRYLGAKRLLLVLDNLEQLPDAAPLVSRLLAGAPGLHVLAASRAPLGVAREHEHALPPLELRDGVQLFAVRAHEVRPDLELTNGAAAAVAAICRRLDGLPLAIELAAARLRALTPEAMLARLDARLGLLTSGPRDRSPRQQTLRATIDWSYELLAEDERTLFRRLGVFAGGFSLGAVEAVCGGGDALDVVESLVAKSLVQRVGAIRGEPRFALLETIREYAIERLEEAGEADAIRRRHAEHVVGVLEQAEAGVYAGRQREWAERVHADFENLRVAAGWMQAVGDHRLELRLAGAVQDYGWVQGRWREVRGWVDHALAADPGDEPRLRLWALRNGAELACLDVDSKPCAERARELLALADEQGDVRARAYGLAALANIAADDAGRAELLRESAEACRRAGDRRQLGWSLNNLGDCALRMGRLDDAAEYCRDAVTVAGEGNFDDIASIALGNLASVEFARGDLPAARKLARESLSAARDLAWPFGVMFALELHGWVDATEGRPERAARVLGAAETLREELGRSLEPFEQPVHDAAVAGLRTALGPERLRDRWEAGGAMTADDAVALATEQQE